MEAITLDNLTILGIPGWISINKMVIDSEPNMHAEAILELIVSESSLDYLHTIDENNVITICTNDNEVLFRGILAKYSQRYEGRIIYLDIELVSASVQGDYQKRTRSFQNPDQTYDDLFRVLERNYSMFYISNNSGVHSKTNRPIFQFDESDFTFLRRLASELNTSLIVDSKLGYNSITIGMPSATKRSVSANSKYTYRISPKYYELGGERMGLFIEDYSYYEVESYDSLFIGDRITINEKELYIIERHAELIKGEIIFSYKAGRETLLQQKLIENKNLVGAAFKGIVDKVYKDSITIDLEVDKDYAKQELTEFDWKPITSNLLYAMPEEETTVVIQHNDCMGYNVLATASIRTNKEECSNTKQPIEKMFYPKNIGKLTVGNKKLAFTIGDTRVELRDDALYIGTNIRFETIGIVDVSITAPITDILSPSMIEMFGSDESQLVITQTIDGMAETVSESGTIIRCYDPYNDAPIEVPMEYNWKKLFRKVIMATVVVLTVAAIAAATVATGGAALGLSITAAAAFKGVVIGAALGGAIYATVVTFSASRNGAAGDELLYKWLDSFANGAIISAHVAAAGLPGGFTYSFWETLGFATLGSLTYQYVDYLVDIDYGYDYDEKEKTIEDVIITIGADVISTALAYGVGKLIDCWVDSILAKKLAEVKNLKWKDYFKWAKEANERYGANFKVDYGPQKQLKTIPKHYIDELKAYWTQAINNRPESVSKLVGVLKAVHDRASDCVSAETGGPAYEIINGLFNTTRNEESEEEINLNFKFDDNDNLVVITE